MKVSKDALISALLHPSLYLLGDSTGCIALYCRQHVTSHPIAYYGRNEGDYRDPKVAYVLTIPSLWAAAVKHLDDAHRTPKSSRTVTGVAVSPQVASSEL